MTATGFWRNVSGCIRCSCALRRWWCASLARSNFIMMRSGWRGARCGSIHIGEELVRTLITLLALDERRCEAIQYYQTWSNALKDELDIGPLPATRKVLEDVRALDGTNGFGTLRARLEGARI